MQKKRDSEGERSLSRYKIHVLVSFPDPSHGKEGSGNEIVRF